MGGCSFRYAQSVLDRLSIYEKEEAEGLREDAASFDEDEEALAERLNDIADVLDR